MKRNGLDMINDPTILRNLKEKGKSDLDLRMFFFPGNPASEKGESASSQGLSRATTRGRPWNREELAERLDTQLRRLSRASAFLGVLQGKLLSEIRKKGSEELGYTRIGSYVREELGMSERRGQELLWMEGKFLKFPLFRAAYEEGRLGFSKARLLLRNLSPEDESVWLEYATGWSVRMLEDCLRAYRKKLSELISSAAGASGSMAEGVEGSGDGPQAPFVEEGAAKGGAPSTRGPVPCSDTGKMSRKQAREWAERQALRRSREPATDDPLPDEEEEAVGECIRISASARFHEKWRRFLEIARRLEGKDLPAWGAVEYACADFLAGAPREAITGESGGAAESPGRDEAVAGHRSAWWRETMAGFRKRRMEAAEEEERDLQTHFDGWSFLSWEIPEIELPDEWKSLPPAPLCESGEDVHEMHEMLKDMRSFEAGMHYALICLLGTFKRSFLFWDLQFRSFEHYAKERLGMPKSTSYRYAAISKELSRFPALVRAVSEDVLCLEKATLCGKISLDFQDDQWIPYALRVPTLRLRHVVEILKDLRCEFDHAFRGHYQELPFLLIRCEEQADRELQSIRSLLEKGEAPWMTGRGGAPDEDLKNRVSMCAPMDDAPPQPPFSSEPPCASAVKNENGNPPQEVPAPKATDKDERVWPIEFYLPGSLIALWEQTILAVRRIYGENLRPPLTPPIRGGEIKDSSLTLAECLEILVESFLLNHESEEENNDHAVIERDGWRCTMPGCGSRWNLHVHHIVYRSHWGTDDAENETALCLMCHQRGVHKGYIKVSGTAPGNLIWEIGVSPLYPVVARYENGLADTASARGMGTGELRGFA